MSIIPEIIDNAQQTHYFNNSVIEPRNLYEYDALYRLTKASGREHNSLANLSNNDFVNNIIAPEDGTNMRNYTQTYQYDELGNLLQMKSNGVWTRNYRYNFENNNYLLGHGLQSTTNEYTYDAHGNMTKMPHLPEMLWDYKDNFKEATLDLSGNKVFYTYDAEGNRVRKVVVKGNIVEERFYIGDYEVYRKTTNGTLNIERKTLNIMDDKQKIAQIDSSSTNITIRYQLSNHLGSAALELDENADIISYEEYHPFGTSSYRSGRSETEVSQKRYKYVGKERDEETGLYYYGARYYASWLGRFVSVDPMAEERNWATPYNAMQNDPVNRIDPTGALDWHPVIDDQGNISLEADKGDDFNSLMTYLDDVGVDYGVSDIEEWAGQVSTLAEETNYDIQGKSITSSTGKFSNITGNLLIDWSNQDVLMYKTNFPGFNCSPTTFNRSDKALELVYGKDVLGKLKWSNPNYRHWQKAEKSTLSSEQQKYFDAGAVGVLSYLNLGYEVSLQNAKAGDLMPGAVLNLQLGTGGHSVFFKNYTYTNGQITGFEYWETHGIGSSTFGNTNDWQIRKAANFY